MVIIGRAMTVLEADVFSAQVEHSANVLMAKPFGLMLEALDDLKAGEVYICTGASPTYALWGELMSVRAMNLGAAG
ncbi:Demethylmenaquinone methyltransferase-like protein [hydrothermal vent metagenome]|uniref:Demethylmenaquinone methyltransferase-like protein n=1 Tax=hydrothermal vent metagenome TaxID=652676 RepID=A0A3B0UZJ5_9ZZZZ